MSDIFRKILHLVQIGQVRISEHGYDELAADDLFAKDIVKSVAGAILVESYPDYPKGPCVLLLQRTLQGDSVHAVWGIPKGVSTPAVLITAYRPDSGKWEADLLRRKR